MRSRFQKLTLTEPQLKREGSDRHLPKFIRVKTDQYILRFWYQKISQRILTETELKTQCHKLRHFEFQQLANFAQPMEKL